MARINRPHSRVEEARPRERFEPVVERELDRVRERPLGHRRGLDQLTRTVR